MAPRDARILTSGEWRALSAGLAAALRARWIEPVIVPSAHPLARIASLWRGGTPILTRGAEIWWPGAAADLSVRGHGRAMAVLQHELQHVLDYVSGWLSGPRYLANPRHWIYGYRLAPTTRWDDLGAEQRATVAEHVWLMERGLAPADNLAALKRLVPWAG